VKDLLRTCPAIDVNQKNVFGRGHLHECCHHGHFSLLSLLLGHPDIDVNLKDGRGYSSFFWVCFVGQTRCARVFLRDPRVDLNQRNNAGETPLRWAAYNGHYDIIRWWIASEREMDLGKSGDISTDALWGEKRGWNWETTPLLEGFKENPGETRHAVRVEVGWYDEAAAEVFALVVFVSDGLLGCKADRVKSPARRTRFFRIATQLPLELQMVLCHRLVGSGKMVIPGKDTEVAFRDLAARLQETSVTT